MATHTPSEKELKEMVKSLFPALDESKHKGEAGRLAVIGGSEEYTGAPYFAAITTMKVGVDQVHVCCAKEAAVVIKGYSPDLIVHPTLDAKDVEKKITDLYERLHLLIIGPGIGRTDSTLKTVEHLIKVAKEKDLPIVIDADGLWLINQKSDLIKGYSKAILTPNQMEAQRLWKAMNFSEESWDKKPASVLKLSQAMGNIGLVVKGPRDIITDGKNVVESTEVYGLKRAGGQGDIMTGTLGAFYFWALDAKKNGFSKNDLVAKLGPVICAGYAASLLTRKCSKLAFDELGRSMLASDMLRKIPEVVKELQGSR